VVFRAFDLDGSGQMEPKELLVLGKQRSKLGQKQREWTEEKNAKLIAKMDKDGDGSIDEEEFVQHFLVALHEESDSVFLQTVDDFIACALGLSASNPGAPRGGTDSRQHKARHNEHPDDARIRQLKVVFRAFDLDGSGQMEPKELLVLGKQRSKLGQKQRKWTEEKNAKLIAKMDKDGDGSIDEEEFVRHFLKALRAETDCVFKQTMLDFIACVPRYTLDVADGTSSTPNTSDNPRDDMVSSSVSQHAASPASEGLRKYAEAGKGGAKRDGVDLRNLSLENQLLVARAWTCQEAQCTKRLAGVAM